MRIHKHPLYTFVALILIASASCTKDAVESPDPAAELFKFAEGYAAGAATKVTVYTERNTLETGYTRFFLRLNDSLTQQRVDAAQVSILPMMDMGTMKHSAPYENPASQNAVDGLFPCAAVFTMPSTGGTWTLGIDVKNNATGRQGRYGLPVTVAEPARSRMKSFTSLHDGKKYFLALIEPSRPRIGINDYVVGVYRRDGMMSFPADASLRLVIEPEMPTMGHGSPNNVNPTPSADGHYRGKVNFTMTGFWRVHTHSFAGTAVADTTQYFDIEF